MVKKDSLERLASPEHRVAKGMLAIQVPRDPGVTLALQDTEV